jgi:hypothetical protein
MGLLGKAAWVSLAASWFATAGVTAVLAAAPPDAPAVVHTSHEALVTIPPGAAR